MPSVDDYFFGSYKNPTNAGVCYCFSGPLFIYLILFVYLYIHFWLLFRLFVCLFVCLFACLFVCLFGVIRLNPNLPGHQPLFGFPKGYVFEILQANWHPNPPICFPLCFSLFHWMIQVGCLQSGGSGEVQSAAKPQ